MRALIATLGVLALSATTPALAQEAHPISGEWVVDLRLSLEDAPYSQPMRLEISENKRVSGTFYGSAISKGRLGSAQGRTCISFQTSDNSGLYHHSACLVEDKLVGQSWSEGRDFLNPWTAERKQ